MPQITAKGGTLVYAAMYPNSYEMPLNLYQHAIKRLTITGLLFHPIPIRAQLLLPNETDPFVEKVFKIDEAIAFAARFCKYLKILIQCNDDRD